jgi:hypothetical protein
LSELLNSTSDFIQSHALCLKLSSVCLSKCQAEKDSLQPGQSFLENFIFFFGQYGKKKASVFLPL